MVLFIIILDYLKPGCTTCSYFMPVEFITFDDTAGAAKPQAEKPSKPVKPIKPGKNKPKPVRQDIIAVRQELKSLKNKLAKIQYTGPKPKPKAKPKSKPKQKVAREKPQGKERKPSNYLL